MFPSKWHTFILYYWITYICVCLDTRHMFPSLLLNHLCLCVFRHMSHVYLFILHRKASLIFTLVTIYMLLRHSTWLTYLKKKERFIGDWSLCAVCVQSIVVRRHGGGSVGQLVTWHPQSGSREMDDRCWRSACFLLFMQSWIPALKEQYTHSEWSSYPN